MVANFYQIDVKECEYCEKLWVNSSVGFAKNGGENLESHFVLIVFTLQKGMAVIAFVR